MNVQTFKEIFNEVDSKWEGDNAYQGLQILSKYTDNLIQGAGHDIIYGPGIEKMIEAGITEDDVRELARLNWMVEDDEYLACFI